MRHKNYTLRFFLVLSLIWLGSAALLWPASAIGSDPFNTGADVSKGNLDVVSDDAQCNKEKIHNSYIATARIL